MSSSINQYNSYIKDPNSFVFSLKSNGKFNEMKKFNIKDSQYAFWLDAKALNDYLFIFGYSDGSHNLWVNRKNVTGSFCKQQNTNYEGLTTSLSSGYNFTPKRITVIQMV